MSAVDPGLDAIIRALQSWLHWHEQDSKTPFTKPVTDDTHLYTFYGPEYPTRGTIKAWIAKLQSLQGKETPVLREYISHKHVRAMKITRIAPALHIGSGAYLYGPNRYEPPLYVDDLYMQKHEPKVGGYLVVYQDGYSSFSPAEPFEQGYTLAPAESVVPASLPPDEEPKDISEAGPERDDVDDTIDGLYGHFNDIADLIGGLNARWWKHPISGADIRENEYCFSNKLMLVVTELAEACEGDRKTLPDTHLPQFPMRDVEIADALIRLFDLAHAYNMDIGQLVIEKLKYNRRRADHKRDARLDVGGKTY